MSIKSLLRFVNLFFLLFILFSCHKEQIETHTFPESKLYVIEKFSSQPFLGETYVNDYDYEKGNQYLIDYLVNADATGACSSFRSGDFAARNLDWFIRDYAMLVVHMASNSQKHRYASVGIISSTAHVNRAMIASGKVNDKITYQGSTIEDFRSFFPIFTTDGINEKGVCVNTNIVVHEDGVRPGYVPCTGDKSIGKTSFVALPRFILDNCASCDEAIKKCSELNLTQAYNGSLANEDSHIFVSDNDKTVILEWYNNKMVYTEFPREKKFRTDSGMPAIMTNFYNCVGNKHVNSEGFINLNTMLPAHPYAMGVERYELLRDGYDNVNSIESAQKQIEKVLYSKYFQMGTNWYTENGMLCKLKDGVWYYPLDITNNPEYAPATGIYDAIKKTCEPGGYQEKRCADYVSLDEQMSKLDKGIGSVDNWYTEFTDIFDIKNKILYIMPQEGWYKHEYIKFTVAGNN